MRIASLSLPIFLACLLVLKSAASQETQSDDTELLITEDPEDISEDIVDGLDEKEEIVQQKEGLEADANGDSKPEEADSKSDPNENKVIEEESVVSDPADEATSDAFEDFQRGPEGDASQAGPLVDLLGPTLLSLEMLDETRAILQPHNTTDALKGKQVIGLYFSADWCGPCRQFTPELVSFYEKMNKRRGKKDKFEIVWISRCRDIESYGTYFATMKWYALPPDDAVGVLGQKLSNKYKVQSIPTLVLLDNQGSLITRDGRNKIPKDKAGIGFPWRSPLATIYITVIPRSLRMMLKSQVQSAKQQVLLRLKSLFGLQRKGRKSSTA